MHDRTEWTKGNSGPQTIKGKSYKELTEFTRPCATCGEPFSIYVTKKIANGHADSNSFGLKNCEKHRRNKPAVDNDEIEELKRVNAVLLASLADAEKLVAQAYAELDALKAKYELPGALQRTAEASKEKMPWD